MNAMTFNTGNKVERSECAVQDTAFKHLIEKYGCGPFCVKEVTQVPHKCSCGASYGDQYHQYPGACPYKGTRNYDGRSIRDHVGHGQWVTIQASPTETIRVSGMLLQVSKGGRLNETTFSG